MTETPAPWPVRVVQGPDGLPGPSSIRTLPVSIRKIREGIMTIAVGLFGVILLIEVVSVIRSHRPARD